MKNIIFIGVSILLLGCSHAFPSGVGTMQKIDPEIEKIMKAYKIPGLTVILIENGDIVSHQMYGVKNIQTGQPLDDITVFESASLSKPIFAYGVLKLVETGQLSLDKPLTEYLVDSEVKNDPRLNKITARMVLNHTTGFSNLRSKGENLKIYFNPGEKFSYSGEGFMYLQKVVEHLTGMSIDDYLKRTVFNPLGMSHSSYVWQQKYNTLKAIGYDDQGRPVKPYKSEKAHAAFSLHTTALDYAKFMIAMIKTIGLKPETFREMLSPQISVGVDGPFCIKKCSNHLSPYISWGLGWGLQKLPEGIVFWHWGDNNGFKSYVEGSQKGSAILIFTNSNNGFKAIREIVYHIKGIQRPAMEWLNY